MDRNKKDYFIRGIIAENPLFVGLLGTCPALATTTSLESAFGMGILFILVLIGSNVFISLFRKIIPEQVKIPCYIVVIATFVTIVKMLCEAFLPELFNSLGVFVSLIVVNCIVLGRAEAFASSHGIGDSFMDAMGNGLGYLLALLTIAFFRELLGTGGFRFGETLNFLPKTEFLPFRDFAVSLFVTPAGAFLVLGVILALIAAFENRKKRRNKTVTLTVSAMEKGE